ncbi:hypothetical protein [Flavobacterium sp.]|uniref:hypothetical protein n=1 Tax=Flavobacterium sp. TaxID=239 RepID=UPI002607B9F7|nr:hypothetical protein [Flavobacterium sp.]MDD2984971.1 hypothetical protein [Flavobacterium sp.]
MKKITLLVMAVFALCISCDDDDDTAFVQEDFVLGKWYLNQIGSINAQNKVVYVDYVNTTDCEDDNLVFNEDNTFEENDFELINSTCQNLQNTGTFDVQSNKIILSTMVDGVAMEQTYTIVSLTYVDITITYTDTETNKIVFLKFLKQA